MHLTPKLEQSRPASATEGLNELPAANLDVGIVVLNYNTRDLLRDCLRSILEFDRSLKYQICVVDNASSDGSPEMVASEFPQVHLIRHQTNIGFSAGNNAALRWFGFAQAPGAPSAPAAPRYALLLNPDTLVPQDALTRMLAFMDADEHIGVAGPRVMRPDGTLDKACRRSFPTPEVSFYRLTGLSKLFSQSPRFNAYNLEYLAEDAVHEVDSVVGAYMQVRREAMDDVGLLDEAFFMYGEDLDWAKRIKDAGWQVWYNGSVEITHVKEAASRQSSKSRIDFYEAMWIFYRKHYQKKTNWLMDKFILTGIVAKGSGDVAGHLWRFCRNPDSDRHSSQSQTTTIKTTPVLADRSASASHGSQRLP